MGFIRARKSHFPRHFLTQRCKAPDLEIELQKKMVCWDKWLNEKNVCWINTYEKHSTALRPIHSLKLTAKAPKNDGFQ